ncbi:hypothetical protein [Novacetimonas maltaceti]|uniref:Phage DNA packaging protein Nu1 n=1 Tax=Novacetimonas maltaceti TaxID=1203393 RepID=A0A2S3W3W2_9PROT|nr:hypothetical protein [Novacetimonas maltaceti]POF63562.1 hypothetical protein KMAL_07420 [Novacetimonas maltaceti]
MRESQFAEKMQKIGRKQPKMAHPFDEFDDILGSPSAGTVKKAVSKPLNGKETGESLVSASTLADWFGVVERTVDQLGRSGVLRRELLPGHKRTHYYPLKSSVQRYAERLRQQVKGKEPEKNAALIAARTRKTEADAMKAETANAIQRGTLVERAAVVREWATHLANIRAAVMQVPGRIAMELPGLSASDKEVIDRAIRDALKQAGGEADA